jgi:hypothetical protein
MPRQFVQDKAPEHGLFFKDELQIFESRQFVEDDPPQQELFVDDKLRMPMQFLRNKAKVELN